MDGLLIVDKPVGPTSHDVVARLRRVLGEQRVGHTGTLDPSASGVLPIVVGRATRLARFLSGAAKTYEAVVRLGVATETADAVGDPVGPVYEGAFPGRAAIDTALNAFRGTFLQQPPAFSAKKIGGQRSYVLARRRGRLVGETVSRRPSSTDADATGAASHGRASAFDRAQTDPERAEGSAWPQALPAPVNVTTYAVDLLAVNGDLVTLRLEVSAGFYVRSLAHDLGVALGTGGHLAGLRRTKSGSATVDAAVTLGSLEQHPELARRYLVPMAGMLTDYPFLVLSPEGVRHAAQGRTLLAGDLAEGTALPATGRPLSQAREGDEPVRLLTPTGELLALATWKGGGSATPVLHPSVVLG